MVRWVLRISVAASLLLIASHVAFTFKTYPSVTLESVQFAELGLPLLFLAFLNGSVWSATSRPGLARLATHVANVLMLVVAGLVAHFAPVPPAYLVVGCAAALAVSAVLAELKP